MTKAFDDKARNILIKDFDIEDLKYDGTPIKDMIVRQVDCKFARPYIATFHYSKTMPDSTKFVYAGYLNGKLCGIVCYGMGCGKNQYTALIPDIQNGQYCELTRLWCPDNMPRNTESKLISTSLKMLPSDIKLVVSFADSSKQHSGIIYQATNWYYLGSNKGGKLLVTEDGIEKHTRLLGIYKMRHPELKDKSNEYIMDLYGFRYSESGEKYRYVYIRGTKKEKKEMYNQIKGMILPYPKQEEKLDKMDEEEIIADIKTRDYFLEIV